MAIPPWLYSGGQSNTGTQDDTTGGTVSSVDGLFEEARTFGTVESFLAFAGGGLANTATQGLAVVILAFFEGFANLIADFLLGLSELLTALPFGLGQILASGAAGTATAVQSNGLIGIILAVVLSFAALAIAYQTWDWLDIPPLADD